MTEQGLQMIEEPALPAQPQTIVPDLLRGIVERGVTPENVGALEKLVGLYERMEDRKAAMTASQALRALQAEAKGIVATSAVPDRSGGVRYKYAPYEAIMAQAQPLLDKYGFSVRFSQRMEQDRETIVCILMHDSGHTFTNEFTVRIGSGPPGASATQADASAGTVAQREALCDALNIVRRRDDDAALVGAPITKEQAEELWRRVTDTESSHAAFLKFCGVEVSRTPTIADYEKIGSAHYDAADEMLRKKERKGR